MNYSDNNASSYNFSSLLRDFRWRPYRLDQCAPHSVRVLNEGGVKSAALIARRTNNDWAIAEGALRFLAGAVSEGRLCAAFIVLVDPQWVYVTHGSLTELVARIGDAPANGGQYGPYFWINSSLELTSIAAVSDEVPF